MSDGQQPNRDELPLEIDQQIDRLSDEFESAFKKGECPRIDDFLARIASDYVPALLRQLVALEAELRAANDERPGVDEYVARFPDQREAVLAGLAMYDPDLTGLEKRDEPQAQEPVHDQSDPESIGRFQIKRCLGRGGYGVVYLAHDPGLDRLVAVKVPRLELLRTDKARGSFLHEARTAAKLKHPALVTVYEVQDEGEQVYIVQEFIEGQNLAQWAHSRPRSWEEITPRMIEIATAVGYVHQQGYYHRDLKPGNILIDKEGHAHVADFGLAVHEDAVRMLKGKAAGTPRYMSPEQIRGETHRIDNRTDIWALGVILYELLSGQRPFTANEPLDLYEEIQELDPKSPRTRNPEVPKELERICFKCLAKRRTHRYPTAGDLIEDLEAFLATCSDSGSVVGGEHAATPDSDVVTAGSGTVRAASDSTPQTATPAPDSDSRPPLKIVPKGLRSFDEDDKDFFLELLPGPRDRDGLPDSIRFWKSRIEQTDADRTFPVGVMYGPSGCGKSSLVKAGLLPHLAEDVLAVFVEATPNDTELRLLKAMRKHIPGLGKQASLSEVLAQLREGYVTEGQKVLLVLDQFEQWLHSTTNMDSSQLVRALRQCDGANVQGLILVRDDFWLSTTRFMQALEVSQLEGVNSALVDLFDPIHARRVLRAFGLAYARLPEHDLSVEQQRFLDRAVQDLTDDGKVICVQLSLFADMMKGREWTPASLQEVGGTSGVGVAFLDETFTAKTAPPTHRLHAKAAQAVLKSLLPEVGTDIKGQMQPAERLLDSSGYADRPADFRDVLQILNSELRLITPTEPEEAEAGDSSAPGDQQYYQLTHDYLVPSLREWLTRKQKETRRGRAELRLLERAALWNAKPENQQLPSWWEDLSIRLLTDRQSWTEPQSKMMRQAARYYGLRTLLGLVILIALVAGGETARRYWVGERERLEAEAIAKENEATARELVDSLLRADLTQVPDIVRRMQDYPQLISPLLANHWAQADEGSPEKLKLAMALLESQPAQMEYLYDALLAASAGQFTVLRDFLGEHQDQLRGRLWKVLQSRDADPQQQRLRAAGALATYEPKSTDWNNVANEVAGQLVAVNPTFLGTWQEALRPVGDQLAPSLASIVVDPQQAELPRTLATSLLADYAQDDPETLASAIVQVDAKAFAALFAVLERNKDAAIKQLQDVLDDELEPTWGDGPETWEEPTTDTRVAIEAAQGMLSEDKRFAFVQALPWNDLPGVLDALKPCGYRPTRIRPYRDGDELLVAVVWARDGGPWRLERDLSSQQVAESVARDTEDGLLPGDVAAYMPTDASQGEQMRYLLLWSPKETAEEERRVVVDLPQAELEQQAAALAHDEFAAQIALHVVSDPKGERRYCGIWSNQGASSELRAAYAGFELVHQPQWDVSGANEDPLPDVMEECRRQVAEIDQLPTDKLDLAARRKRSQANYHLGNLDAALDDLDVLVAQKSPANTNIRFRAMTLARLGRAEEALETLNRYLAMGARKDYEIFAQVAVHANLGRFNEAEQILEKADVETDHLFIVACAAAHAALAAKEKAPQHRDRLLDRAFNLLRSAVDAGFENIELLRREFFFAPLHSDPRFHEIFRRIDKPATYAALWRVDTRFESRLLTGRTREEQLRASQQLAAEGFRPVAWTAAALGEPPTIEAASVWHRPLIPDQQKERLAQRQASAAVALLRLGQAEQVWPLLKHQPDPRLRSYILSRLTSHGTDPGTLWQRLIPEEDVSTRRALILGLGDFAEAGLLSPAQQGTISAELLRLYEEDPDPGIHGAAEWVLKQLGQRAELARVRTALATGEQVGERRWYVTKQGQHTMMILQAEEPFLMGSPAWEAERFEGPTGRFEMRHRRRIGRRFAIGAYEVTVAQFRGFQRDHYYSTQYSREQDAPINRVSWFQAAEYCNWLSDQEGLDPCYDPTQKFADGMRLYDDYLQRTGYRLPTEAEWEYACRAGATTARYYGETASLLGRYAWYTENSQDRWMLPVGSLRPNDFGLCDSLGNAYELCQDRALYYPTDRPLVEDVERAGEVRGGDLWVLRGGSFIYVAPIVRSAYRLDLQPTYRNHNVGFRLARTYP